MHNEFFIDSITWKEIQ